MFPLSVRHWKYVSIQPAEHSTGGPPLYPGLVPDKTLFLHDEPILPRSITPPRSDYWTQDGTLPRAGNTTVLRFTPGS